MRNLRKQFGGLMIAGTSAALMIVSSPALHAAGLSDGSSACAFFAGVASKVPSGVPGSTIVIDALGTVATLFGC